MKDNLHMVTVSVWSVGVFIIWTHHVSILDRLELVEGVASYWTGRGYLGKVVLVDFGFHKLQFVV